MVEFRAGDDLERRREDSSARRGGVSRFGIDWPHRRAKLFPLNWFFDLHRLAGSIVVATAIP